MNIVVLAGGISTERDVSLVSGMGIYKALKKKGHNCILLDSFFGYDGEDWKDVFSMDKDWTESISAIKSENPDLDAVKAMRPDWKSSLLGPHVIDICRLADIVFFGLHGMNGEDGRIQACFDLNGILYTGTDYMSSAICMDKSLTKDLFRAGDVPCAKSVTIFKAEDAPEDFPLPCVVKACHGGSSVGVYLVNTKEEYDNAVKEAFTYDEEVMIEQFIKGREFSIGVVDGTAYPIIEIAPINGFYDYKNKYQPNSTVETCPAELSEEKTLEMQKAAEKAFKVLHLRDYARFDCMMQEDGQFFFLEANTLPGMTPASLLPQEAAALGYSYEDLCQLIIDIALRRKDA